MKCLAWTGWLLSSAFLGTIRHEGAHWVAFKAFGVPSRIELIPRITDEGRIQFARCVPTDRTVRITRAQAAVVDLAPALAALAWLCGALAISRATPLAWIDVGTAAVDLGNWIRGALFRIPGSDGESFLRNLNPEIR